MSSRTAEVSTPPRRAASDEGDCPSAPSADLCEVGGVPDLTVLVHRAAQGLRGIADQACRRQGLTDGRDWLVLTALTDGAPRSQLDLARLLGIDKSTLTLVLDRLERTGLVVRPADPSDRRVRIPRITAEGRQVWEAVRRERDDSERALLLGVDEAAMAEVRTVLARVADAGTRTAPRS